MEPSLEWRGFEDALRELEQSRESISQLLGPTGPRRITGDIERRCLALVEMEMSGIVACVKSYPLTSRDGDFYRDMQDWLQKLAGFAKRILESTDSRRRTLLDQAVVYCRRRNSSRSTSLLPMAERFLIEADDLCRYRLQLLPIRPSGDNILLLAPQTAEGGGGALLVGIDSPVKHLLRWLAPGREETAERNRLAVMSIVGPVGIGKTTLATELHHQLITCQTEASGPNCFYFNIMARLSKGRDGTKLLLQEILSQISDPAALGRPKRIDQLASSVSELLQNKRYFICIDDIREASEWEEIKDAFPDNGLGSRILFTSHVGSTAWSCCPTGLVHEMKPLKRVDSERLLITRAFGSKDAVPPDSVKLIDKILMRCDGIPLLINGMADWLKEQLKLQLHQEYEEELNARVPKQLVSALSSAYDDLPNDLKILSLYVSMFPYGYKFDKHLLASMFPYVYKFEKRPMMNFSKLVDWSIITKVSTAYKSHWDEDKDSQWQVNHFMHRFLAHKSAENSGFALTSDTLHYLEALTASNGPRRLALHNPNPKIPAVLADENLRFSETRSLAVSAAVSGIPFNKFENLLELDLEGCDNLTDENFQQVCKSRMLLLQYLRVRNTRVTKLPEEIKDLCNLKVLDVSNTLISEVPHEIKDLCNLKVLSVSDTQISEIPLEVFKLELLDELDIRGTRISHLPKQIAWRRHSLSVLILGHDEGKLNSVETTTMVPHDIVYLRELETLATIDLSEQPASFVNALGDISGLVVLAVTWSPHQSNDQDYRKALLSSIQNWGRLQSLTIHCGLGCSMEFLSPLSDPPMMLEKFKVTAGRFSCVPRWISKLLNLSFVEITVCKQRTEDLQVLGRLPKLQCVILGLDFIPSEAVVVESEGFPELQRFSVDCPNPWLNFSTGAMWKLRYLQLKFCAIPASKSKNRVPSGIGCLQRLTEVALRYSLSYANSPSVKNTEAAVRKQVATHLNPIDLFINGIQNHDAQAAVDEEAGTEDGAEFVDENVVAEATTTNQIQSTCEIEEVESES